MTDEVNVIVSTISLPTYGLKSENRNPVFRSQYGVAHIYPYTKQDHIDFNVKEKQYTALLLENRYLKVTVIPDLGGRVYSVFDKISKREVFYKNSVIKFSPLAIRGAFFSGGIEFSFPVAHAPTTCDPVNWEIQKNDDGSASVSIGGIEHISRLRWTITLTLYPDRSAISQDVNLKNPNSVPGRYHYWTNASLDANEGTEFIYPFHRARSYEYAGSSSWPFSRIDLIQNDPILPGMEGVPMWPANNMQEPINFRWQKNMLAQVSIFGRNIEWDYFGAWQHSVNHGYAHVAKFKDVSGMKLWSWGNKPVGVVNQTALTDDGSEYAETQCGAMETQLDFDFLPPYSSRSWREWWLPLRDIGGLTCASELVGVRIVMKQDEQSDKINLVIAACPAIQIDKGSIKVQIPGKVLYENTISLSPEHPWTDQFVVDASIMGNTPITLLIFDNDGTELINYVNDRDAISIDKDDFEDKSDPKTAQDYFLRAVDHENFDNRELAKLDYITALKIDDHHKDTHFHYGVMLLRSAQFDLAENHLKQAQTHGHAEAPYFRGIVALYEDRVSDAEAHFRKAFEISSLRAASAIGLGKIALRTKNWQQAIEYFGQAKEFNNDQTVPTTLQVIALRCSGNFAEAENKLHQVLTSDPLNHIALYELSKEHYSQSLEMRIKLAQLLGDDFQYSIDLACFFIDLDLFDDAIEILESAWAIEPYSICAYLIAYLYERIDKNKEYSHWLKAAQSASPDFGFPSRLEEVTALTALLNRDKQDNNLKFFLGNFLYAHERYDEAVTLWIEALQSLSSNDVLQRNLGLAFWERHNDYPKAIHYFEKALKINPDNQDIYLLLDDLYKIVQNSDKREALLEKIDTISDMREDIRKHRILMMVELGYYEKALDILTNETFLPLEMDQSFHDLYVSALMMRANNCIKSGLIEDAIKDYQLMLQYPENLGVGMPTKSTQARIYYLIGIAYEKIGKYRQALESWHIAASEHHTSNEELFKYVQLSLDKISRYSEIGFC